MQITITIQTFPHCTGPS